MSAQNAIQEHLSKKMTISFWLWNYFYGIKKGEYFHDLEQCFVELKERGFNTIRVDSGAGLCHTADGEPRGQIRLHEPFPGYSSLRQIDMRNDMATQGGCQCNVLDKVVELFELARKYDVRIILSSWFYLHTFWFVEDDLVEEFFALPPEKRFMRFAVDTDRILAVLKARGLQGQIAFVEIFNEFDSLTSYWKLDKLWKTDSEKLQGMHDFRHWHEEALDMLKARHPDLLFAIDTCHSGVNREILPRNAHVWNHHMYYSWGAYWKVFETPVYESGFDFANAGKHPALGRFLRSPLIPIEAVRSCRKYLQHVEHSWPIRVWLYNNLDERQLPVLELLLDEHLTSQIAEYKKAIDDSIRMALETRQALFPDILLVVGEGATYCGHPKMRWEEKSDAYWELVDYVTRRLKEEGYWGCVARTNSGPEDPSWIEFPERLRHATGEMTMNPNTTTPSQTITLDGPDTPVSAPSPAKEVFTAKGNRHPAVNLVYPEAAFMHAGNGAVGVNCGGPAADGLAADQAYRIGSWGYVGGNNFTAEAVSNAPGLPVHLQTYRAAGGTFEYRFDVPRGVYNVKLHFTEPVFNRAGDRRFNVWINGATRLMDYDLYADAGGRNKAVQKEYDGIAVLDGQLVVRFGAIGGGNQTALVQAIEVRQDTKAKLVSAPAPDPAVRVQSLDGQWQIAADQGWAPGKDPDQVGIGRAEKWYTPDGFPLAASRPIQVPGHIWEAWRPALAFPFVFQGCENGVYWYGRSFVAAMPKAVDMRYFLRFGNCEYSCEVWLNGKQVGSHVGASASFEFDVTDALLPGDNFVALRVFSPGGILGPPIDVYPNGTGYAAFSGSGGLQQSVVLQARPQVRIEDVFARPDWKTGNLPLEVTLDNRFGGDAEVTLKAVITERKSGKEVASVTAGVRSQPGQSVHALATKVTPVRLWSPDDPFLYAVKVTADWAGKRDAYEIPRVGFRELRVVNGVFMFNGKWFYPKCMHGVPISEDTYLRTERNPKALIPDFVMIKNAGFNMYRPFAHAAYPSQLDQADELGFLIYNEHPGTCWNVPVHHFGLDLSALIRRDRNHPSVVIWGLLNERGGGVWASPSGKPVTAAAASMLPALRKVDDTRLFLLDSGTPGMSNPGSTTWDIQMNDYHLYPAYPLPWGGVGGVQGGFCSEGSIGSSWNPYASRRIRQRLGAANDELCAPLVNGAIQWIEDVWKRYGLIDTYTDPAAMFVDSERLAAREREVFFNSMRSNPDVTGYSMTSLGDNYGTCGGWGEGILNSAQEFKADHLPVLQAGWARLGWTVLVNPRHAYAGQPVHVKVGMFNEDQLAPGSYPARFTIAGPTGEVWRKDATVTVPGGEKAPLSFGVLDEDVTVPGLVEGRYTLAATLVGVTNVAGGRLEFTVTQKEKHADLSKTTLTVLGLDPRIKELLTSRGATLREFQAGQTFDREAIVVGTAPDVATWRALYQHIARGAHAILLSSDTRWFALPSSGKGAITGGGAGWLYRQEIIARNHPIFRDMPAKVLMPDYYGPLLNGEYFNKIVVPDESVVIRLWCTLSSRGEMGTDGVIVGTYRHHAGKFTVNAFNLLGNLGMPAADRMVLNMAAHAAATAAPLQPLPEKYDEELDKLGIR